MSLTPPLRSLTYRCQLSKIPNFFMMFLILALMEIIFKNISRDVFLYTGYFKCVSSMLSSVFFK